ncbi:hypothetical protein GGQ84_000587 [Desulfitispora alkaliphila]|uniref:anti-sigma factor domain-containing protein n=1 Tax=Desulfitispora alkaliphila TaxID=622674 RepID=UPI003D2156A3
MSKKNQALVMKIKESTMLVVTQEGDFWEVPLPQDTPKVGDQVAVSPPSPKAVPTKRRSFQWNRWLLPVTAAIMFFMIGTANWFLHSNGGNQVAENPSHSTPVAPVEEKEFSDVMSLPPEVSYVVAIDINPSIELHLDSELRLIHAESKNNDGKVLLETAALEPKQNLPAVMDALVQKSQDLLYFSEVNNLVLATLVSHETQEEDATEPVISQVENSIVLSLETHNIGAQVGVREGTATDWNSAKEENTSLNKAYIQEILSEKGIQVSSDELERSKLNKVLIANGIPPGQIVRQLKQTNKQKDFEQNETKRALEKLREKENKKEDKEKRPINQAPGRPETPGNPAAPGRPENPGMPQGPTPPEHAPAHGLNRGNES